MAAFVKEMASRPSRRGSNVVMLDSGVGLSNATLHQRLVPVRLFYDYLIEEGLREANPVRRGRYTPVVVPVGTSAAWCPASRGCPESPPNSTGPSEPGPPRTGSP